VNPIANASASEYYGKVVLGIQTKVAYPYMFLPVDAGVVGHFGYPFNDSAALAAGPYSFLADTHSISYTLDTSEGTIHDIADPVFEFQYEDTTSCSHNDGPVEDSTTNECEQNWALTLTPMNGACYISGDYTITFAARCMYNKPVCVFQEDTNVYQNTVVTTLSIKSTQMCPSLVENIDLTGQLCTTGRAQDGNDYLSSCAGVDATYVQGETTHFRADVASANAAIVKTEIMQIYARQNYTMWLDAPSELLPRYDNTYNAEENGKVLMWSDGTSTPHSLAWTPEDGLAGVDASQLETIMAVCNSDCSDASWTSSTQAGFQVKLNPYIFPAPHDRATDITFTVVLKITYQGFDDFTGATGILSGDTTFGGSGSEDHAWCNSVCVEAFDGAADTFCDEYTDAATYCPATCAGTPTTCTRRRLGDRRNLQTMIEGGDDFVSMDVRVTLNPSKAEINGHVDADSNKVRFTLNSEVEQRVINQFNENRPLFYSQMEYKLTHYTGAITGQFKVQQMTQTSRGSRPGLEITVDIDEKDGTGVAYSPASLAQKLEMLIQTGKIYEDPFFHHTEIYAMHYEAVEESPDRVHFGQVTPLDESVEYDSSSAAGFSLLLTLLAFLLW